MNLNSAGDVGEGAKRGRTLEKKGNFKMCRGGRFGKDYICSI